LDDHLQEKGRARTQGKKAYRPQEQADAGTEKTSGALDQWKRSKGEAGLEKDSVILVDQILAWDNRRFVRHIGILSDDKMMEVKDAFRDFFDFWD
jgi:hypothetical protein